MRDGIGWGGDDGGIRGMREFNVAGQRAGEGKVWGPWQSRKTVDLVITLDADSGLNDRRRRRFERGDGDTPRGVNKVKIRGVEERDRVRATVSTEDTTTLSTVLITDRN